MLLEFDVPNISGDLLDIKGKTWWGLIRMLLEFDVPNISGDLLDIKGKTWWGLMRTLLRLPKSQWGFGGYQR